MSRRASLWLGVLSIALAGCTFDEHANDARGCDDSCAPGACYLGYCLQRVDDPAAGAASAQGTAAGVAGIPAAGAGNTPTQQGSSGTTTTAVAGNGGAAPPSMAGNGGVTVPGCASGMPAIESCNGLDDDCDGALDEDSDVTCYPAGVAGCAIDAEGAYQCTGLCAAGLQACTAGQLGACTGAVQPTAEACGGAEAVDENCNGTVDDGCPCEGAETQRCYSGRAFSAGVGVCRSGTQRCVNGEFGACEDEVVPTTESCANQGRDDDCDFFPDDVAGAGAICLDLFAQGVCGVGQRVCRSGALTCVTPEPEDDESSCDGQDEDCDGDVDEDFDLGDDPNNCGGCDVRCASGDVCCDGSCRDPDVDAQNCGGCGRSCGTNAACCGGGCVATNTDDHCGGCGGCGPDEACCGGGCVATNTNDRCGGCDVQCGEGCTCQGGDCLDVDSVPCP